MTIPAFKELSREEDMQIITIIAPFADISSHHFKQFSKIGAYHCVHITDEETEGQKC